MENSKDILNDRMLTPTQLAKWLKLELLTVYKWTSQGKIPHIKLSSKALRFSEKTIEDWLQSKTYPQNDDKKNNGGKVIKKKNLRACQSDIDALVKNAKKEFLHTKS